MRAALLLFLTACGRLGFDSGEPAIDAMRSSDAAADGATDFCTTSLATSCPSGAMFCDDFETSSGASFPKWDSVTVKNWYTNGAADPATSLQADGAPCRGTKAAHSHAVGDAQVTFLHKAVTARPNPLYVRIWFRVDGSSPDSDIEILGLHDSFDSQFINIGAARGSQALGVNVVGFTTTVAGTSGPAALEVDRWSCLELGVRFDTAAAGRLQLWLDEVPSLDADNVVTEGSIPLDTVLAGVVTGMVEPGTFDVEIDEVAFSGSRLGCN